MPKKKGPAMTPEQQSKEFERTARALMAAGELDPIEADAAAERLLESLAKKKT